MIASILRPCLKSSRIFGSKTLCSWFCNQDKVTELLINFDEDLMEAQQIDDQALRERKIAKLQSQLKKKLHELDKEQKASKIKNVILETMGQQQTSKQSQVKQDNTRYIPNNLVLKKLRYGNSKILFMGINEENEDHCLYVKRLAEKFVTETAVTALAPDMPYFIKTEGTFLEEWKKVLMIPNYAKDKAKFYLNPVARSIQDINLKGHQINLVRNSLNKSKEFNEMMYSILQYYPRKRQYIHNGLLVPLLINNIKNVYMADFPIFKERQMWAMTIPLERARELFQIYKSENIKSQTHFDPRVLFPEKILSYKFKHMTNIIKLLTYQNKSPQKPIIFVCPAQYSQLFCNQWIKQRQLIHYFDLFPYKTEANLQRVSFIEFIEKLVIFDMILEPVITKYFIRYESFPFLASDTIGGKQHIGRVFLLWKHYYNLYVEALASKSNQKTNI